MNDIDEIKKSIPKIIENITLESGKKAFKSEDEIQGYILGSFTYLLPAWNICRECHTKNKYKKDSQGCLFPDIKGKSGKIDFTINKDDIRIGIEIEYPRGKGRIKNNFISHIKNDSIKLQHEMDLKLRYILVFLYHDLEFNYKEEIQNIQFNDVFFSYVRLYKRGENKSCKSVKEIIKIPENWF